MVAVEGNHNGRRPGVGLDFMFDQPISRAVLVGPHSHGTVFSEYVVVLSTFMQSVVHFGNDVFFTDVVVDRVNGRLVLKNHFVAQSNEVDEVTVKEDLELVVTSVTSIFSEWN